MCHFYNIIGGRCTSSFLVVKKEIVALSPLRDRSSFYETQNLRIVLLGKLSKVPAHKVTLRRYLSGNILSNYFTGLAFIKNRKV